MNKVYYVSCDRQGGTFGMGRLFTATEWLEQAINWADNDNWWTTDEDEEEKYRKEFISNSEQLIKEGKEQDFIDYIADVWELDFEEGDIEKGIPEEFNPWDDNY